MAEHSATITWTRDGADFSGGKYSRAHEIAFDGGVKLAGSASPSVVKAPLSREDAADPEEMFVASLSMCHMLWFLDFARRAGFVPDSYVDAAVGVMGKDERGKIALTTVTLKPKIEWIGDKRPAAGEAAELHHKAHDACFIANSFRGEVVIDA